MWRTGGREESRTEKEFRAALPSGERMIRVCDGIIRNERLQTANLLKIALGQSTTPDIVKRSFVQPGSKVIDSSRESQTHHS